MTWIGLFNNYKGESSLGKNKTKISNTEMLGKKDGPALFAF